MLFTTVEVLLTSLDTSADFSYTTLAASGARVFGLIASVGIGLTSEAIAFVSICVAIGLTSEAIFEYTSTPLYFASNIACSKSSFLVMLDVLCSFRLLYILLTSSEYTLPISDFTSLDTWLALDT